ncbi:Nalp (Nacht leucine rich repeat and pyrin domain containing) [Fasciola gigantica]|uniref:Nalp (Nacht leucine rich repeat and pyrin domain containing) n=1 Tax=Fasciola gigantica TaxID=46835 RepID=A0A504Y3U7_FASGI|nr:Nalp (Nacht leucine rich repeat and pyrin domain containing) [Fasciola gigantica]
MPPKQQAVGMKKSSESTAIRAMRELLKDYEIRAERYETTVAGSIRKQLKKAQDDDRLLTRVSLLIATFYEKILLQFLVDPQDRRLVEYWDDDKMIKALSGDVDEGLRRKKAKHKQQKEDKPLVKVLPLIESLRARRYTQLQEFFVWDCHVENDDSIALAGILARGCYPLTRIELVDCFLDARSVGTLAAAIAYSRTLRDLCLDFNDLGERGCRVLCGGLSKSRYLVHLSLSFCGLTKQCGLWIGNLVVETAIRELVLDGNPLEAEGVIALLSQLSEAAESEGFERAEEIKRKQLAQEEAKRGARPAIDLDAPEHNELPASSEPNTTEGSTASPSPQAGKTPDKENESSSPSSKKRGKKKGKRGKKGAKNEPPPSGPQISILRLADTGINHMGRGGNFAPVRCMQLLKSIISHSKDLQEIDLFANEVGDLGARQILEGILARKDAKLPQIGVRMGHRINQDTFDVIHKLAPGPKKKKGKAKK